MKKLMINKKKGFTLVEIIVVLVILAVLAAVAVPSMVGFVEQSRGRAFAADARVGLSAAQVIVTEHRVNNTTNPAIVTILSSATFKDMTRDVAAAGENLGAEDARTRTNGFELSAVDINAHGQVTGITYLPNGYTIRISDGILTSTPRN